MAKNPDRIHLEYTLTFDTLFHCGTGIRSGLIDRTVVRDSKGYLYVPGSTFKGVLRERCEQLARFHQEGEPVRSPHDAERALQEFRGGRPTLITRIFGSQLSPGHLFFDDARQIDLEQHNSEEQADKSKYKGLQVDVYTQVRMARPTRTAVAGALYTSEFGTQGMVFNGEIHGWLACFSVDSSLHPVFAQADPVPTYSLLLLLAGLRLVDRLGGNKSTGKGRCKCEIVRLEINGKGCPEALWLSWLENIDVLEHYEKAREE
ncbi:MAG: hypothetical protein IMW89_02890 [Ktedonobacteraceae bacterium]|nr:hypothetical protein [Ktedonobacteraceae bacterium]